MEKSLYHGKNEKKKEKSKNEAVSSVCTHTLKHREFLRAKSAYQLFVVMLQPKILIPSMVHLRYSFLFIFPTQFSVFFSLLHFCITVLTVCVFIFLLFLLLSMDFVSLPNINGKS